MNNQYKIYCYTFENNNKITIPYNYKITIKDIATNYSETYSFGYECINYLLAFNIDRYNEKYSYLFNEYKKNNIEYDSKSSDIINSVNINEYSSDLNIQFNDSYTILKGNNKLFTLNDLITNMLNRFNNNNDCKHITILTVIKDIKYLHKKSLYNFLLAPLNRYIMDRNSILFDILSKMNYNTITTAYDICCYIESNLQYNRLAEKNSSAIDMNSYSFEYSDNIFMKHINSYFNLIDLLNKTNYNSSVIISRFIEDYRIKNDMLQRHNEIYNNFLIYGFESLPYMLRETYINPFDSFFKKTNDADKIISNFKSYNLEKKILKIKYEEYNMMYNYEIQFN